MNPERTNDEKRIRRKQKAQLNSEKQAALRRGA
jgi:hypothetical protein